jgi:hypothetical protein
VNIYLSVLVGIIEELLAWKSSGSVGIRHADQFAASTVPQTFPAAGPNTADEVGGGGGLVTRGSNTQDSNLAGIAVITCRLERRQSLVVLYGPPRKCQSRPRPVPLESFALHYSSIPPAMSPVVWVTSAPDRRHEACVQSYLTGPFSCTGNMWKGTSVYRFRRS